MGRESVGMSILVNICWKRGFKALDINHNSSLRFNENFRESKSSEPEMLSAEVLCKVKDLLIAHKGKEVSREHWAAVLGLAGEQKKKSHCTLLYQEPLTFQSNRGIFR